MSVRNNNLADRLIRMIEAVETSIALCRERIGKVDIVLQSTTLERLGMHERELVRFVMENQRGLVDALRK